MCKVTPIPLGVGYFATHSHRAPCTHCRQVDGPRKTRRHRMGLIRTRTRRCPWWYERRRVGPRRVLIRSRHVWRPHPLPSRKGTGGAHVTCFKGPHTLTMLNSCVQWLSTRVMGFAEREVLLLIVVVQRPFYGFRYPHETPLYRSYNCVQQCHRYTGLHARRIHAFSCIWVMDHAYRTLYNENNEIVIANVDVCVLLCVVWGNVWAKHRCHLEIVFKRIPMTRSQRVVGN